MAIKINLSNMAHRTERLDRDQSEKVFRMDATGSCLSFTLEAVENSASFNIKLGFEVIEILCPT
jgi:hypothetical protein